MPSPGQTYAMLRRLADAHRNGKPLNQASDSVRKMVVSGDVADPDERPVPAPTEKVAFNDDGDVVPVGVKLRDPEDFTTLRKDIFDGMLDEVRSVFPQTYGGVRMELADVDYEDPEDYDLETQKQALLHNKNLGRRIRGTVRLFDDKTGAQIDEKKLTLMKVPYLTERGTFLNGGSEYSTINQMRLLPGIYARRKANGDLEAHANVARGTGSAFRVRFEPASALYKMDIKQSSMRLYSLLHDLGVPDEELKQAWGPEVFEINKQAYDPRVFDKAYNHLAKKPDPAATREQKAAVIRDALESMRVNRRVLQKNLPNLFDMQKSAAWREEFQKQASAPVVTFPTNLARPQAAPKPAPVTPTSSASKALAAPTAALRRVSSFSPSIYKSFLWNQENAGKTGYDPKTNAWRTYSDRGHPAVGPGIRVAAGVYEDSKVQAMLDKAVQDHFQRTRDAVNRAHGPGAFDRLPEHYRYGLTDFYYNGVPAPKLTEAMLRNDLEALRREHVRYTTREGKKVPLDRRNKAWWDTFVAPYINEKRGSANFDWLSHVFVKLAAGAVVLLPTSEGKYLLEKNPDDHEWNPGKLRPPGGGQEPGEDLKQTIVREIHEEFGIPPAAVESKIKLLGYEYRDRFKGSAVFELADHGLEPGTYQASNDPNETVTLVEADLDDPDYVGPQPGRLSKEPTS